MAKIRIAFQKVVFLQVPCEQNQKVDSLARLASTSENQLKGTIPVYHLSELGIHTKEPSEIQVIQVNVIWLEPIIKYLKMESYPRIGGKHERLDTKQQGTSLRTMSSTKGDTPTNILGVSQT